MFVVSRTFADRLQELLDRQGWTAYELAKRSGVPRSNISVYLSGRDVPKPETIEKIAGKLGADEDELQALADAHRLGPARIARMLRHVPEAFEQMASYRAQLAELTAQLDAARKQHAIPATIPAHFASVAAALALVLPESPRLREVFEALILRAVIVNEAPRYKHQMLAVSRLQLVNGAWLA